MDGPKMSASRMPALSPCLAKAKDRFAIATSVGVAQHFRLRSELYEPATVLLPTPPLAEETAMTFSTPVIFRCTGFLGQFGGVPDLGSPWRISAHVYYFFLRGEG